ncbi:MAG: hypothetical protein ACJ8J0_24875 [Longimicrobiaceae bacterium]
MSDAWNEDERVAAFLDGRLDERERAEMLARLAADDEAYAHFAATAAILREAEEAVAAEKAAELEEEDGYVDAPAEKGIFAGMRSAEPPPRAGTEAANAADPTDSRDTADAARASAGSDDGVIRLHPRKPAPVLRWLALAAGIVGLALVGRALWPRASSAAGPMRLAMRLEHAGQGLPTADWNLSPPWTPSRGDELPRDLSEEEKAVEAARAGALLVDLSVAVRGKDAKATRRFARQIAKRYDPQGQNGELKEVVDGAGGAPERLEPYVEQATDRIAGRLRREPLELGAWTEAARLAAERHDSTFFRDPQTGPTLDRLAAAKPSARAEVERVRGLLGESNRPQHWGDLADALEALLGKIASD